MEGHAMYNLMATGVVAPKIIGEGTAPWLYQIIVKTILVKMEGHATVADMVTGAAVQKNSMDEIVEKLQETIVRTILA